MTLPTAILPTYIDSSMLSAFRACPKKFYHEYVLGLRPQGASIDLHFGGVFASALEHLYRLAHSGEAMDYALGSAILRATKLWGDFIPPENHLKTLERLHFALDSYVGHYGYRSDPIQPYEGPKGPTFEFSFSIPLTEATTGLPFPKHPSGDPFLFVGRSDLLGQINGQPVIRDDKTTTRGGASWTGRWDMRGQFMGYLWAAQTSGIPVKTFSVRGVIIHAKEILHMEVIRQYPQHLIERWLHQTYRDIHRILDCVATDHWDMNFADACASTTRCPFIPLCESLNPEPWMANYKIERWNPLGNSEED